MSRRDITDSGESMSTVERSLHLRQVPLFADLPDDRLAIFAEETHVRRVEAGEELVREGMPVPAMYVIVDGEVTLSRRGELVQVARRSSSLGAFDWLTGRATVTARAREPTVTLEIGVEALRTILEDNFDVVVHAFEAIGRLVIERRRALGPKAGYPELHAHLDTAAPAHLGLVQRTLLLRATMPFARGSVEALANLARQGREVSFAPGHRLWAAGARADHLVVLVRGSVRGEGSGGQAFAFGAGDTVGFVDCLGAAPRWYSATAITPTVGLRVNVEDLLDVLEDDFELTLECLGAFATQAVRVLDESRSIDDEEAPRSLPMPGVRRMPENLV